MQFDFIRVGSAAVSFERHDSSNIEDEHYSAIETLSNGNETRKKRPQTNVFRIHCICFTNNKNDSTI